MKLRFLLSFIIYTTFTFSQSDSVKIRGTVIDSYTRAPIEHFNVVLSKKYGSQLSTIKTDKNGNFEFNELKSEFIYIILSDSGYIRKSISSRDTSSVVNFTVKLRPQNHVHSQIDVDSTLVGSRIKNVLQEFRLEASDINEISEPPGISRGFDFELGDSTIVYIFTERTPYFKRNERKWKNQKIIGVGIARMDGTTSYFGDGRPLIIRLTNKYLIE